MKLKILFILWVSPLSLGADDRPICPKQWQVLEAIALTEKLDETPRWELGKSFPAPKGVPTVRLRSKAKPQHQLVAVYNQKGHITELRGNGPLLNNDNCRKLVDLPELRVIRIDHNIPHPGSKVSHDLYSGKGFEALHRSKLEEIKIGAAFHDEGLKALSGIKSLKRITIIHSRVTDAGVAHLRDHAQLESVFLSPMGRPLITNASLKTLATLPKLTMIGLQETFVTYEKGFSHLKGKKLNQISLKLSLVLPTDLEKIKADHPNATVEISSLEEVAAKEYRKQQLLKWASPEARQLLLKLK